MANTDNKRRFSRIPFNSEVHLVSAEGDWYCQLLDISLQGMLTTLPDNWLAGPGENYLAEMKLGDSDVVIRMEVQTVHVEKDHVGFRCEHIDLDSISHLKRLVELNIGDAQILDRELSQLCRTD